MITEIFLNIIHYIPKNWNDINTDNIRIYDSINYIYSNNYAWYIISTFPQFSYLMCIEGFIELVKNKKNAKSTSNMYLFSKLNV